MPLDTSDYQDVPETNEATQEAAQATRPLSQVGRRAMQGGDDATQPSGQQPDLATVHPRTQPGTIETLSNVEAEGETIALGEGKRAEPPKEWRPGGPERG
ncbi:MAG: hypothetical protein CVU38_04565 [Chloroflexi bacterium HGW-Chloroflexi-1]|nr:MAG: hypothetical protein CVU38_04565 [Chloroflexi bacterium HGW-Chloroflexi-1]